MKDFLRKLVAAWTGLTKRLSQIEDDLNVKEYGEVVRRVERLRAITVWRNESLSAIQQFRSTVLPKLRATAQEDVTTALQNLVAGKPPDSGYKPDGSRAGTPPSSPDPVVARLDALLAQMLLSNAIALNSGQSSEALQDRLNDYLRDAREGQEFSYRAWATDRLVVASILRGRAAGGDARAGMALDLFAQVEQALISRAFPGLQDQDDGELTKCETITKGAIVGQGDASRENLGPASDWFGFLARGLENQRAFTESNPELKAPKPRLEVDQDVLNRIAMGRQPAAPIARLWGDRS